MKKKMFRLTALLIAAVCFCGCGYTLKGRYSTETAAVHSTDVPSENSGHVKGIYPALGKNIRIGVIYNGDPQTGNGYSYAHYEGIKKMQKQLGLSDSQIISRSSISESDDVAISEAFRELVNEHCNIIFATSVGFSRICGIYAGEYPDIVFAVCSGTESNGTNFVNYFGKIYEARYLSGIIAGLNTKTNSVGFVAAKGLKSAEVTSSVNAFAMGVYSVNKKCRVLVCCTESWNDPDTETAAAEQLMEADCDILAQHCDSSATQIAAARAGVMGIGYNSDMSRVSPHSVITSVIWDWSVYYSAAVRRLMDGTWEGENYYGGLKDGLVSITKTGSFCTHESTVREEQAENDILDGKLKIFYGKMCASNGDIIGKEGTSLEDDYIRENMNWYFKNVETLIMRRDN